MEISDSKADDRPNYLLYAQIALCLVGILFFSIGTAYITYLWCTRYRQGEPDESQEVQANIERRHVSVGAKSAASKSMAVTVKLPSLTDSSVYTQSMISGRTSTGPPMTTKPASASIRDPPPPPARSMKEISKSLKISEYSPAHVFGKMSITSKARSGNSSPPAEQAEGGR